MTDMPVKTIQEVVSDFLGSAPSLEEIIAFRLPEEITAYAHRLLEENRAGTLNEQGQIEMREFRQIDHLMTLVKAKAQLKLRAQS